MELSHNQKSIYNLHLSTYRLQNNKPYKLRQDFEGFINKNPEDYKHLLRIEKLFSSCPAINRKLFFKAPYEIYKDKDYFDLRYYSTQAAIKSYNLYIKEIEERSPDSTSQIDFIKDSLIHIRDHCIQNKMTLGEYISNDRKEITPQWAVDMVSNNISFYVLVGLEYFGIYINQLITNNIQEDEIEMFFGEYFNNLDLYRKRLNTSTKAKKLVFEGIKSIVKKIEKELKSNNRNDSIDNEKSESNNKGEII